MKNYKLLFISIIFFCLSNKSFAQNTPVDKVRYVEASVQGGWLFAGSNTGAKIINALIYSLSVGYVHTPETSYELNINSFYSKIVYDGYQGKFDTTARYSQSYYMFGIVRSFRTEIRNFTPFLSTVVGLSSSTIKPSVSQTQIAAGILGGIKYALTPRIGLKFQARVQAPLSGIGLGLSIGTGGPSVGIGSYSRTVQFDLSSGLFFTL